MSYGGSKRVLVAAGDTRPGAGILCNDPMGLCIAAEGAAATSDEASNAGVFTSMVRLASQLQGAAESSVSPLITIETDEASILVKTYDGHTVALRVPAAISMSAPSANGTPPDRISATSPSDVEATDSGGEVQKILTS